MAAFPESSVRSKKSEEESKGSSHRESVLQDEPQKANTSLTLPVEYKGILERYRQTTIFQMLSPLFFNMKFVGLYFERHYPDKNGRSAAPHGTKRPTPSQVYATVCLLLHWTIFLRSILLLSNSEDHSDEAILMKIVAGIISIFTSINATVLYIASHRADWLPALFIYWDGLHGDVSKDRVRYFRKVAIAAVVISWTFMSAGLAYAIYGLFFAGLDEELVYFTKDMIYETGFKYLEVVHTVFFFGAWLYPIFLMCGAFTGLYKEFLTLNTDISRVIGDKTALESEISSIRLRHQNLCTLVEKADKPLNPLLANSFVMNVITVCIMLYMSISNESVFSTDVLLVFYVYWTLLSALYLGISSVGGAVVNAQVSIYPYGSHL